MWSREFLKNFLNLCESHHRHQLGKILYFVGAWSISELLVNVGVTVLGNAYSCIKTLKRQSQKVFPDNSRQIKFVLLRNGVYVEKLRNCCLLLYLSCYRPLFTKQSETILPGSIPGRVAISSRQIEVCKTPHKKIRCGSVSVTI